MLNEEQLKSRNLQERISGLKYVAELLYKKGYSLGVLSTHGSASKVTKPLYLTRDRYLFALLNLGDGVALFDAASYVGYCYCVYARELVPKELSEIFPRKFSSKRLWLSGHSAHKRLDLTDPENSATVFDNEYASIEETTRKFRRLTREIDTKDIRSNPIWRRWK